MKLDVTKNAIRTTMFGIANKVIMIVLPFIVRTIMIKEIGLEYVGLGSLFTSILQVLSLSELGFGSAMVFNMYKPIAQNDQSKICALLNYYKNVYRIMGCVVLGIGLVFIFLLDYFISGEVPGDINIHVLYILYLINTVIGYFLFAYKSSLLFAHQRYDVYNNILTILNVVNYIYQGIVLILYKNYYLYIITMPIVTILLNIISYVIVNKKYPQYKPEGTLSKEDKISIKKRVVALAGHKIGGVLTNSFDNIVISAFLGFTILGIYNNYYYIISSLNGFMIIATNALTAGVGNQIVRENKEKVYQNFIQVTYLFCWIVGWCSICIICLTQTFIEFWVGKSMLLTMDIVIFLALYFYIFNTRYIISIYKDANGMWGADVLKPYVEGFLNLAINILLVKYYGIKGVVISTIITMGIVGMPWETYVLFKGYFKMGEWNYFMKRFFYFGLTILAGIPTYFLCGLVKGNSIQTLILKGLICIIIPNIIVVGISCLFFPEFKGVTNKIKSMVPKNKGVIL